MLKIDLHLHTIASGHAHNTILEYINQAKKLKMKMIGFADHGPSLRGVSVDEWYFQLQKRIPKIINGIRILKSIETNIINEKGGLDISDKVITEYLDYVIANFHDGSAYNDLGQKRNTEVMIKAIKSGKIDIISHPFAIKEIKIDIEKVSKAACLNNVLLEVNTSYLTARQIEKHPGNLLGLGKIIKTAKKYNKKVIIGSDAHNIWDMADDSNLKKIMKEIGLTDKMIINNYPKELMKMLKIK